ncbi:hypothetical protein DFH09DRAFT_1100895 [Mycena vulgaris]|nr:hypothetical protein DFH09DRAFT_1100895 [Mycena vulgaris]
MFLELGPLRAAASPWPATEEAGRGRRPVDPRHFERDPTTGEVLWFPGPPIHVSRAPPPCHRLEYLHFLAKKYTQELAGPEPEGTSLVNGNGNGVENGLGGEDDLMMEEGEWRGHGRDHGDECAGAACEAAETCAAGGGGAEVH